MDENVQGYFAVMNDEEKKLVESTKKLSTGRAGVFYRKQELISTLQEHPLNERDIHIVEVCVPQSCITNANHRKFGIKCGRDVPVTNIEAYSDARKKVS